MHEAIHAEMRRFLYGAKDSSTLPGFPGSFAEGWVLYVKKQNGKDFNDQVSIAEHNAMALKYVGLIIEGLEGFDNNNLTYDQYYALALEGLFYTDVFSELNRSYSERQEYEQNFESALQSSSTSCSN